MWNLAPNRVTTAMSMNSLACTLEEIKEGLYEGWQPNISKIVLFPNWATRTEETSELLGSVRLKLAQSILGCTRNS